MLGGVISEIPVEPDCDTLEQQLRRDLFLESKYISFDVLAVESLTLRLYDGLELEEFEATHEEERLQLRPIGRTALGALCEMVGMVNEFQEPELIMLAGCFYATTPQRVFTGHQFVLAEGEWPEPRKNPVVETEIHGEPVLVFREGVATGAHLAFWQTYSLREKAKLKREVRDYHEGDFMPILGTCDGALVRRYRSNSLYIAPSTIIGMDVEVKKGDVISVEV